MKRVFIILMLVLSWTTMIAQEQSMEIINPTAFLHTQDSITPSRRATHRHISDTVVVAKWQPDAMRAVWMGAIIPGYGQIYNRSYWKLPIVYGGFMGCVYAVTTMNRTYTDYKQAYRDIYSDAVVSTDPTRSYIAMLPEGYTVDMMGGKSSYTSYLQGKQNTFRRYRDISIVATVVVYALSLIDAYVDAQLYDFDISTDLSMNIEPQLYYDTFNNRSTELKLAINF